MTTYNTGNPLGSSDPRDLYDNAENLDNFVNGDQAAYSDRLGKPRKSWQGMEDEFAAFLASSGYVGTGTDGAVEDYAAGIEITGYNQILRDTSGEFWRLSGSVTLPYTTTGAGLPEGGNFVAVGDAALRQELALPVSGGNGAALVNGSTIYVGSVAELEALSLAVGANVYLTEVGRAGSFTFSSSDLSAEVFSDSFQGVWIAPSSDPTGASGAWVRSKNQTVTPQCFGAEPSGADSEEQIEAFFSWVNKYSDGYQFSADGDYYVSRGVVIDECRNKSFSQGRLVIRTRENTYIDEDSIRFIDFENNKIGYIGVSRDGSTGGFRNGVVFGRVRRTWIDKIEVLGVRLFGTVISSFVSVPIGANNNTWTIAEQRHDLCGTQNGFPVTFTETNRFYNAFNDSQTSTINANLDDYYPTYARGTPFEFNGKYFAVLSYDSASKEAVVYPCLDEDPNPLASGTLTLLPGGGMLTRGGDSGQGRTFQLNVRNSTCSVTLQAAYGGSILGITSQFNAIDIIHGNPPASVSNAGETIYNIYNEGQTFLNCLNTSFNASLEIIGAISDFSSREVLRPLPFPRRTYGDGTLVISGKSEETRMNYRGSPRCVSWRRGGDNSQGLPGGYGAEIMANPGGKLIISPDNSSRDYEFNLGVDNLNTEVFGKSGLDVTLLNFNLTNTITINAPSGDTVEGAASIVLDNLPSNFQLVAGQTGAGLWTVYIHELTSAASYIV